MTMRLGKGYLVLDLKRSSHKGWLLYWSPNGTPWHERAVRIVGRKRCCGFCKA